jgi:hypothetical protein
VIPVGLGLHAASFDRDELVLDAEQLLDDALGLLVTTFPEVLIADDAFGVDEVQRRPVVVGEGRSRPRSRCRRLPCNRSPASVSRAARRLRTRRHQACASSSEIALGSRANTMTPDCRLGAQSSA